MNTSGAKHIYMSTREEIAEMCEMYANMDDSSELARVRKISEHFQRNETTVQNIIFKHYLGILPKEKQQKVIIQSKV